MKPNDLIDLLNTTIEKTRKETAKEIINEIKRKYGKSCSEYYPLLIEITSEELDDLAKQFGVEV